MADLVFPPYGKDGFDPDFAIQEFASFGYWRDTIEDISPETLKQFVGSEKEDDKNKKK